MRRRGIRRRRAIRVGPDGVPWIRHGDTPTGSFCTYPAECAVGTPHVTLPVNGFRILSAGQP